MAIAISDEKVPVVQPKKKSMMRRLVLVFGIVILVALVGVSLYVASLLSSVSSHQVSVSGRASLSAFLVSQDALFYNGTKLVPYALFNINSRNISDAYVGVSLLSAPPPKKVYMLNSTNQCFDCGNTNQFMASLGNDLTDYSITNGTNQLTLITPSQLNAGIVGPDSILIVPNGYLPDYMLSNNTLANLLNKGTTMVYIGQNFSKLIEAQGILIPDINEPSYLATSPVSPSFTSSYIFNQSTFEFASGAKFGPITYTSAHNGTIIAFSNFLGSWKTPQGAASDVALAIFQEFWIPQLAFGNETISASHSSENVGIALNQSTMPQTATLNVSHSLNVLNSGYARVVLEGFANATSILPDKYYVFYYKPSFSTLGAITMPSTVIPGSPISATFEIFVNRTQSVEPHIDIFNINHTLVESLQPFFSRNLSANYTFFKTFTLSLPAGHYIAQLDGFNNQHYASSIFTSPAVTFTLVGANVSQGYYIFSAYAGPIPLNNVSAMIKVNNQYQTAVQINGGTFLYQLPPGVAALTGNLTFNLQAFNQQFNYYVNYTPPAFAINKQYIYFIIAVIIVILEITLVKAPQRDDFFIDVPNMPEPQKTNIKIKFNDLLGVFDKQSTYYHWRYMPLTDSEFKFGVANSVKWQNLPVVLTFNNTDAILDSMVSSGNVVSADGFYAPKGWEQQSKHDVEYLVTFRKLRNYLTSHGQQFSDMGVSNEADITTVLGGEKAFIVIYSKTSAFMKNIPIRPPVKTYLAFINSDRMEDFKKELYSLTSTASEELKMYIASGNVMLLDADNPEGGGTAG